MNYLFKSKNTLDKISQIIIYIFGLCLLPIWFSFVFFAWVFYIIGKIGYFLLDKLGIRL